MITGLHLSTLLMDAMHGVFWRACDTALGQREQSDRLIKTDGSNAHARELDSLDHVHICVVHKQ